MNYVAPIDRRNTRAAWITVKERRRKARHTIWVRIGVAVTVFIALIITLIDR